MPVPTAALTLSQILTQIRLDLADIDSTNYRWTDAVLARQVDRAVDRYSKAAPNYSTSQIPTITASRIYPAPANSWWMEAVEYPIGNWPKTYLTFSERTSPLFAAPLIPTFAGAHTTGGSIPSGTYKYAVTYTVPGGGETTPSSTLTVVNGSLGAIALSGVPTGPYGVTGRNIYRTVAGGSSLLFLTTIADNSTTVLLDTTLDGALGVAAPTTNTTEGIPQFELDLAPAMLPADATGTLEILAAYKHELDQTGTTIPEKHWDAITLGAEAFTILQYLSAINDNFDYVDGQFRDKVDDTKAPPAWMAQYQQLGARFEARLKEIRNEVTTTRRPMPQWGDKPARWNRI